MTQTAGDGLGYVARTAGTDAQFTACLRARLQLTAARLDQQNVLGSRLLVPLERNQ